MMNIHPAEPTFAFWSWAKCLGEIIFWAGEAGATTCMTDGWREKYRIDIQEIGHRARDASPDDMTHNQVIRSRSLACDLVRMLNTCGDLNSVPCRNWSATERNVVEELAKLKSQFAILGDGERPETPATGTPRANGAARGHSPWITASEMIFLMTTNGIRGSSDAAIKRTKRTSQAGAQAGSNNQRFRFKLAKLTELGIRFPVEWNTSEE